MAVQKQGTSCSVTEVCVMAGAGGWGAEQVLGFARVVEGDERHVFEDSVVPPGPSKEDIAQMHAWKKRLFGESEEMEE